MGAEFTPYHLTLNAADVAGNGGAGRVFFLPGSDGRARRIGERFAGRFERPSDRQLNAYLGHLEAGGRKVDVGAVATGMGCPSLDIVVTELILLGVRHFIRVGTCGSLRPDVVRVGHLVLATGAVRDEGASDRYIVREYPSIADPVVLAALETAAERKGYAARTFKGVVHSKDSLYGLEFEHGPRRAENHDYMRQLREMRVLATEMEAAHLFVLCDVHSTGIAPLATKPPVGAFVRSGAVLAVIGDDEPFADPALVADVENAAVDVALQAALELPL